VLDGREKERREDRMTRTSARADAFAVTHFATCEAHRAHARAVHDQLEALAKHDLLSLAPDDTIADVLGHSHGGDPEAGDSLDRVELQMALEEELSNRELVSRALHTWNAEQVLARLLDKQRPFSQWDPRTVWSRSVRGIVNERVRYSGGCTCAPISAPSNNQMQRTKDC
jgi:hypothetical protein